MNTTELNSTQMNLIYTSLYESYLTADINDDIEMMDLDVSCDEQNKLIEIATEHFDYDLYKKQLGYGYASFLRNEVLDSLTELGVKSIKFLKVISPREYNFTYDNFVCELEYEAELNSFAENAEFIEFIKTNENYQSRDGFHSFVPTTKEKFIAYPHDEMKLAMVVEFLISVVLENDFEALNEAFIDYIKSHGHNAIPYTKSIEEMVELAKM